MLYPLPDKEFIYHSIMGRFFTRDEINPDLNLLAKNYIAIRDEFRASKHKLVYTNWNSDNEYTSIKDNPYNGWKVAALFGQYDESMDLAQLEVVYDQAVYVDPDHDIIYTQNAVYMPTLFKMCLEAGIRQRCGISVLEPGKSIGWHTDPDPEYQEEVIIRGLWGLEVNPQNQEVCQLYLDTKSEGILTESFSHNRMHFFWGRTPHQVHNTLSTPRYCLCFDNIVNREKLL